MDTKKTLWTLGILAVLILVALGISMFLASPQDNTTRGGDISTEGWQTFRSEQYDFEIRHPSDWEVSAHPDDQIQPAFNIYKPSSVDEEEQLPFIHHDDVVQVSIFPEGVPTEGLFGATVDSSVEIEESVARAIDYVLEDGTPWATFINPEDMPASWGPSGFLFSRTSIEELEITCLREGEPVAGEQCDPLFGDEVVRTGRVDEEERAIQVAIMESFRFLESVGDDGQSFTPPTFEQYQVAPGEIYTAEPVAVNFATNPDAEQFRTAIQTAAAAGPNFAGAYTIATWGCGTNCSISAIIDTRDGAIVAYGILSEYGLEYQLDSRLLVVNPPEGTQSLGANVSRPSVDYYALQNSELQFLGKFSPKGEALSCAQVIVTARNPVTDRTSQFPSPCQVPEGWEVVSPSN